MSDSASISTGIAARYASAVFALAVEANAIDTLEGDVAALEQAVSDSADLRDLIRSPIYARTETKAAIGAVANAMDLAEMTASTLKLMAGKRRLFVLPALLRTLRERIAAHKGEMHASVISAQALTRAQSDTLAAALKASLGKDVILNATVDKGLIGGLVVQIGSRMLDNSIRTKLNALQNTMKEVG
ncbi:MAG: F0F1 ATP synthase subunit delta [Rhodobacteraceae bacterium]|nr:F0F1 ATP synthase subunit delta [Paracoccaceae bacterium]